MAIGASIFYFSQILKFRLKKISLLIGISSMTTRFRTLNRKFSKADFIVEGETMNTGYLYA